ncbi:DJ-1/PfpI family protein [Patescibacteria group bacterium]|nr:DJ-1/PfpI family protein [Patescibacteria group bacterium]
MANILVIIAPENFQEIEYQTPKRILEEHGHKITTASTVKNPIGHLNTRINADLLISEIDENDYNAILFVGGGGSSFYFDYEPAHRLAKQFYQSGKLVSAICAAPSILANAGLLNGKLATSFPSQQKSLEQKGAIYSVKNVQKDGKIITAKGPNAAEEFAEKINEELN